MTNLMDRLRSMALGSATLTGGDAGRTDGQLLEDYLSRRDEAAVAALVRRHGAMVWGVCRRVLHRHHDAEDAFQATFLVLIRRAASVSPREMVGNWLYGVAHQTALKARATAAKRQARERQVTAMPEPAAAPEPESWQRLEPLLDQELSRLPAKYRGAIVLCDLEGKTRKEVARQLRIPEGTLSSRLTTARKMLARRLARHGLAISAGALAVALAQEAVAAAAPAAVTLATIKTATLVAAGTAAATGAVPVKVAALTEGMLKAMLLTKLKIAAVLLLAVAVTGVGLLLQAQDRPAKVAPQPPAKTPENAKQTAAAGRPFLDQAVRAAGDVKDAEQKARLLILIARAQAQAGERTTALGTLRRAADLAASLPNNDGNEFNVRGGILAAVINAQAELDDTAAALKTLAANTRPKAAEDEPKEVGNGLTGFWQNSAAGSAHVDRPPVVAEPAGTGARRRGRGNRLPRWGEATAARLVVRCGSVRTTAMHHWQQL